MDRKTGTLIAGRLTLYKYKQEHFFKRLIWRAESKLYPFHPLVHSPKSCSCQAGLKSGARAASASPTRTQASPSAFPGALEEGAGSDGEQLGHSDVTL